ncbi:MAG: LuxR C-terminal-related transcriptional regulator [Alphaproteobacteria bacterium]
MTGIVESYLERLQSASSQDECFELMFEVVRALGFSSFAYDYTPVTRSHDGRVLTPNLLRTYGMPDDLEDLWLNHGYYARDIAWLACHDWSVPFVWTCDTCLVSDDSSIRLDSGPVYRKVSDYFADVRITVGINVPVHVPGGGLATINALKMDPERTFLKDARRSLAPFTDCAYHLQAAVSCFFDSSVLRCRHVRLSEREIECLRLSAQGYTTEQVADRIFRSVPTAALHLKHAAQKLGARNRAQAIARAAHYRLLDGAS